MKLKVYRYNDGMHTPRYDTFKLELNPGMTVLGALFQFQQQFDDSLHSIIPVGVLYVVHVQCSLTKFQDLPAGHK